MSDWNSFPLSELAQIHVSNVDKKSKFGEKPVRLCNYMDVYSNDYISANINFMESTASAAECVKFRVEQGDVLITKDSEDPYDIGIPAVVVEDIENLICGYHLALIKPNRNLVNSAFLSKQMASQDVVSYFSRMAAGSTRYGLSKGSIAQIKISIPSRPQQDKISSILYKCDLAIEKTEALIKKYQQIKAGLMHDLFTRGITADGKLRPSREQAPELYQETSIGWIPKEWHYGEIESLCSDIADCPHSTPIYRESGIPCIRTADMIPGELLLEKSYKVDNKDYLYRIQRLRPKKGDVIYSREGERLGIASPVGDEIVCLGQRVMILRPASNIDPDFLLWSMNHPNFYRRILRGLGATTSPHVNVGDIKIALTPIPPEPEQIAIGRILKASQTSILQEKKLREKLINHKNGLMNDLLTGKVSVKVYEAEAAHV